MDRPKGIPFGPDFYSEEREEIDGRGSKQNHAA